MSIAHLVVLLLFAGFVSSAPFVPALFVLGDSTLDTGNLDYRPNTLHFIRTQELPYGRDFVPPGPTGRASNGKLATDFLAEYLGLPSPIDNLQPDANGQKLLRGLNFAAGGSGILNGTGLTTITLFQQLQYVFGSVAKMNQLVGAQKTSELLASSLFLISTGNNDIFNYVLNPATRFQYKPDTFNQLLLHQLNSDLEELYALGARRIVILSVGPLGCTPLMLTAFNSDGSCVEEVNKQVKSFNAALQASVLDLKSRLPGFNLIYANAYDILYNAIRQPLRYGFKEGRIACCGVGEYHGNPLYPCSSKTPVCANANEHVFWDMVHPTQAMYKLITDALFAQLVKFL